MEKHPERIVIPAHHLMSLDEVAQALGISNEDYLILVIRGEAPPLNVNIEGESFILREDVIFWLDSELAAEMGEPGAEGDFMGLRLTLDEVAAIFDVSVGEYLEWVQEGDAPPLSTFSDGGVGVVRASLDAWASDGFSQDDILAALFASQEDVLEALREEGVEDPEGLMREIFGEE